MNNDENPLIDIEIDKLTNSIENVATGDIFDTNVIDLTAKDNSQIKKMIGNLIGKGN